MKVSSVEEMHNLDKKAIEIGIKEELLMENAGHACYFLLLKEIGEINGKKFIVFAGSGNNGGDGLMLARKLHSSGGRVKIYLMGDEKKYKGAAKINYEILKNTGIEIESIKLEGLEEEVERADVIIDAMLGTGISRNVEGVYKEAIEIINKKAKKVLSIDIPSGINGNNGKIMGAAINATWTVTFGLPKIGNILYPGYEKCGKLYVSHISFPPSIYQHLKLEINEPLPLPERKKDSHKGTFGDVLFIAGASTYYGAPYFASHSFLRAGGGYARLAAPASVIPVIAAHGSEVVYVPMEERNGAIALENEERLLDIAEKVDMLVMGCGVSLNEGTKELIRRIASKTKKPILVDGDGLTAVAEDTTAISNRKSETILTPHPGEMARIAQMPVEEIIENKIEVATEWSKKLSSIIVLKGAHTIIAYPDGKAFINMSGNPGMATAGSGDVLAGVIAAMYGIGFDVGRAARMGVFVHGLAGDIAAMEKGEDGITARDIMEYLPNAMKILRENFEGIKRKYGIEII